MRVVLEPEITYLIIRNIKNGDISALELLYKKYYARVHGFAKKFLLSRLSPDDIVQETFLRIWEQRNLLKDQVLFEKQLYTITKNIILNHLNREGRSVEFKEVMLASQTEDNEALISENHQEKLRLVYRKIDEMPHRRKQIFELHKLHGLSYEEISLKLNISKNTVASQMQRASDFLRKECKEPFG
ncbi:RNA polymerase sigma factor [Ascidiimonas aurantiaca]|uniref:RNA polymerase sigma factor n=1 Tax=Ascidiimonas aurantiaca TaxID=1685432 RepID=UPI0030EE0F8E